MKADFEYSLTEQDYIIFERFSFSRTYKIPLLAVVIADAVVAIYNFYSFKNPSYLMPFIFIAALLGLLYYYQYTTATEKKVKRYVESDKGYLKPTRIRVNETSVMFEVLYDEQNEVTSIYPFSLIDVIFESDNYLYFVQCSDVKILPKRDIPNDIHGELLRAVKAKKNVIYIK